jgi:hypothetical protein
VWSWIKFAARGATFEKRNRRKSIFTSGKDVTESFQLDLIDKPRCQISRLDVAPRTRVVRFWIILIRKPKQWAEASFYDPPNLPIVKGR